MEYSPQRKQTAGQRMLGYLSNRPDRVGRSRGAVLNIRWGARFKPPKNQTTKIRLIPGSYKGLDGNEYEYFHYVECYSARIKKGFISSAKWGLQNGMFTKIGGNCLGYDEWKREQDEGIDRNHRTMSIRLMHAFNVIHLEWYHLYPVEDENGKPVMYKGGQKAGEQIVERVPCEGRRCEMCQEKLPKVFGKKVHWSMGMGHLQNLGGVMKEIGKDCTNCGGKGTIETISWDCSNCGEPIILADNYDMQNEDQSRECYRIQGNDYKCPCGTVALLVPNHECSGCKDPSPLTIFDCDIEIKRVGEKAQSTLQVPRWTATELSDELKEMATPWPFPEIFSADPVEIQAKILQVRNPYGGNEKQEFADYEK